MVDDEFKMFDSVAILLYIISELITKDLFF